MLRRVAGQDRSSEPGAPPPSVRVAAAVLVAEVVALASAAATLVVKTITGSPASPGRALFAAGMALLAAVILAGCARGLLRLRAAARTPAVVLQLLAVPVAYSLWFQADRPAFGAPIMLAALSTVYLLFTPAARANLDR